MKCYSKWVRGNFPDAVKWGKIGNDLKISSNVDTKYDIAYELALAERDAGLPESALRTFLRGSTLAKVIDPEEFDEKRDGASYGNIGRCLHFMGQIDSALVCYQKSALMIEKSPKNEHVLNQGYIRRWIGELLIARKQHKLGAIFLEAARLKWNLVSPPNARHIESLQKQLDNQIQPVTMSEGGIEKVCRDWIFGRVIDADFR